MAAMSYTTLTGAITADGSIRKLVNNPTVDMDAVLEDAQSRIYEELRVREMQVIATLTGTIGQRYINLPADFLDPISLKDQNSLDLELVDPDSIMGMWASDTNGDFIQTEPSYWAIVGTKLYFNVALDAAYTYTICYYGMPASLAAGNTTNFLTTRYPQMLRTACAMYAWRFLKKRDDQKVEETELNRMLARVANRDDLHMRGIVPPERGRQ